MAASNLTNRKVIGVLQRHLDPKQIEKILKDLSEVEGNSSFKQTIKGLLEQIKVVLRP